MSTSPNSHIVHVPAFAVQSPIAGSAGLSISPPKRSVDTREDGGPHSSISLPSSSSPPPQAHPVSNPATFLSPEQMRTGLELQDLLIQHQLMQQQLEMQSRMIERLTLSIANSTGVNANVVASTAVSNIDVSNKEIANNGAKVANVKNETAANMIKTTEEGSVTAVSAEAEYLLRLQQEQLQYQLWQQQQQQQQQRLSFDQQQQLFMAHQLWMYQQQQQHQQQMSQEQMFLYQRREDVQAAEAAIRQNLMLQRSLQAQTRKLQQQQQRGLSGNDNSRNMAKKSSHYNNYSTVKSSSVALKTQGKGGRDTTINPSKVVARLQSALSSPLGSRSSNSNTASYTQSSNQRRVLSTRQSSSQSHSKSIKSIEMEVEGNQTKDQMSTSLFNTSTSKVGDTAQETSYVIENIETIIPQPASQLPLPQETSLSRSSSPNSYLDEEQIIMRSSSPISQMAPDSLQDADDATASVIFPLQPQLSPSQLNQQQQLGGSYAILADTRVFSHELTDRSPSRMGSSHHEPQQQRIESSPRRLSSFPPTRVPLISPSEVNSAPRPSTASSPQRKHDASSEGFNRQQQQQRQQLNPGTQTGVRNPSRSRGGGVSLVSNRGNSSSSSRNSSSSISRSNSRVNSANTVRITSPRSAQAFRQQLPQQQQQQSEYPNYYESDHALSSSVIEDAAGSALGSIVYDQQKDRPSFLTSVSSPYGAQLHESSIEGVPDWEVSRGLGRRREIEERFGKGRAGTFSFESERAMPAPVSDLTSPYSFTPFQLTQYKGPSTSLSSSGAQTSNASTRSRPNSSSSSIDHRKQKQNVNAAPAPLRNRLSTASSTTRTPLFSSTSTSLLVQSPRVPPKSSSSPSVKNSDSVIPEVIEHYSPAQHTSLNKAAESDHAVKSTSSPLFTTTQSPRDRFLWKRSLELLELQ
jgi:hypothetical protein